ncbi:MAG TPA: BamA/TamA family outer membrane protein [Sphingomicrobium sp.]|nr:BamA/TamA family outer membrane protein [Sphingomicrobium sp.]
MRVWGERAREPLACGRNLFTTGVVARLLCAAGTAALACSPAVAQQAPQQPDSADIDPSAPLAPMPDIGVPWPDLGKAPPDEAGPETSSEGAAVTDTSVERGYTIAIDGLERIGNAQALVEAFEKQSALYEDRKEPANVAQVQRRSEDDSDLLAELLRSQGYYDAVVEPDIEPKGPILQVTLQADPGEQYVFNSVELPGLESAGKEAEALRDAFAVKSGDPVVASDVIAANLALKVALGEQGFALAKVGEQQIIVDHRTHLASLVLPVDPGPLAHFGAIHVSGNPPFSAEHLQHMARWKPGQKFERDKVDDLRRALIATGLVASAEVNVVPVPDHGRVDLDIKLTPAPRHTIAGELGYGTGEGAKLDVSWQDRNFINPEGGLTLRGIGGTREQLAGVEFRRNNFGARDRVLSLQLSASHTKFDAYEARTVRFFGSVERQSNIIWRKKWTWGVGTELLATDERGVFLDPAIKETKTFLIAALPSSIAYDGSDDLLDPTRGFRLSLHLSPEISAKGISFAYARAQADGSAYYPLGSNTVLAGRFRFGKILGADAPSIAPSRRFYAGGGSSVRGYGYQRVGPMDFENDPVGGSTLSEFSLEARFRLRAFGGNFGLVPFFDGGQLTNDAVPGFSQWQFGAGVGLRYYSTFGPIRIDVGTPLNPRHGDSRIAVAVSLGQAF